MLTVDTLLEIMGKNPLWIMFSQVTRHPFLYSDPETEEAQVFVFTQEEGLEDFAQAFLDLKYPVTKVRIKAEDKRKFFMDCRDLGAKQIVYRNEMIKCTCRLEEILDNPEVVAQAKWEPIPNWNNVPASMRPLSNPALQTSVLYFAQELHREVSEKEKKMGISYLIEEFEANLARATFIQPVMNNKKQRELGIVILNDNNGNQWMPLFTDEMEFSLFNREGKMEGMTGTLKELLKQLPDGGKGVLLNSNSVAMQLQVQLLYQVIEKFK